MKKLENVYLVTDLDGTLLFPVSYRRYVNAQNRRIIKNFIKNGGKLILNTARSLGSCERIKKELRVPVGYIASSGGVIKLESGEMVRESFFLHEDMKEIISICDRVTPKSYLFLQTKDESFALRKTGINMKEGNAIYNEDKIKSGKAVHQYSISDRQFEKAKHRTTMARLFCEKHAKIEEVRTDIIKQFKNKFQFEVPVGYPVLDIFTDKSDKGNSLKIYLKQAGISEDSKIFVIGDGENDISMFREFYKNSFSFNYAQQNVREEAKNIIESFKDIEPYLYE